MFVSGESIRYDCAGWRQRRELDSRAARKVGDGFLLVLGGSKGRVWRRDKMSLYRAFGWSFFSELVGRAVAPVLFVVLARLLTPADYGVVAAATMVISFSQVFWAAGMGKALIHFIGHR